MTTLRIAALFSALLASPALAATCEVNPQVVMFGGYDTLAPAPLDGVGKIRVTCNMPVVFGVALSGSSGSGERRMTGPGGSLDYALYHDPARIFIWRDDSMSGQVGLTGSVNIPIYGRIRARQNVAAGSYIDSVTVTVSY